MVGGRQPPWPAVPPQPVQPRRRCAQLRLPALTADLRVDTAAKGAFDSLTHLASLTQLDPLPRLDSLPPVAPVPTIAVPRPARARRAHTHLADGAADPLSHPPACTDCSCSSRPCPPSPCLGRLVLVAPVPISPMARPAHRSRLPACADRHASSGAVSLRPRAHATCPLRVPQSSCAHAMCTLPRAPAAHPSHMIRPLLLAARAGPALAPGALLWRACRATTRHVLAPRALATCSRHAHRLSRAQLGSLTQPGSLTHSSACWYS